MNNSIKKNLVVMIIFLFIFPLAYSANSYGTQTNYLRNSKTSEPCNGYTLICAGGDPVFLIDMNKSVIHTWS
ncbi:MAG: hypothetical protein NTX92_08315, partial [Euryarchaeota archaeon]|nr:hypothetical protein [Euryarchaeota archaeon]